MDGTVAPACGGQPRVATGSGGWLADGGWMKRRWMKHHPAGHRALPRQNWKRTPTSTRRACWTLVACPKKGDSKLPL